MAISRISDLPEITDSSWIKPPDPSLADDELKFSKSLLELSWCENDYPGTYTSKAVRVKSLQDFIADHIAENDEFYNEAHFYAGAKLSGYVGINDDAQLEPIPEDYGLYVRGNINQLEAKTSNIFKANSSTEINSNYINVVADSSDIDIAAGDSINLQAENILYTNADYTYIASSIETAITQGSPDNVIMRINQTSCETTVATYVPTAQLDYEDVTSKHVVNIEYLNNFIKTSLSAELKNEIIAEINQQSQDDPDDPGSSSEAVSVYGSGVMKLFELKTFDCNLSEISITGKKRYLYKLGSVIQKTDAPNMFNILSQASGNYSVSYGGITISCKKDTYGHYVVIDPNTTVSNNITQIKRNYSACWIYVIDTNANTITLPTNNMFFRAGGFDVTPGVFYRQSLPKLKTNTLNNLFIHNTGSTRLHTSSNFSQDFRFESSTIDAFADSSKFENNDDSIVSPPSIQSCTYMVCY